MKKIIALSIVLSMILPPGALFAKARRGAQIMITKTDGTEIEGELTAIKQNSTLLLESYSGIGESINVSEVKSIKIIKKSKIGLGVGLGFLIGGVGGALIGGLSGEERGFWHRSPEFNAVAGGVFCGLLGAGIGAIFGGAAGSDETIYISSRSPYVIAIILERLRSKARFPDYK